MIGIDASVEDVNFGLGTLVELEEELASGNDDGKLATKRTKNIVAMDAATSSE